MEKKQLFVFRTHRSLDRDVSTLSTYIKQLDGYCNICVLLNVEKRENDIMGSWKSFCADNNLFFVVYFEEDLRARYYFYKGGWLHGQYGLSEAYKAYPNYTNYWFIEYDVRFTGSIRHLMEAHEKYDELLLGTLTKTYLQEPGWWWWINETDVYLPQALAYRSKYFSVVTRINSSLMRILCEKMERYHSNIESFIASFCRSELGETKMRDLEHTYWTEHTLFTNHNEYISKKDDPLFQNKIFHPIKD